MRRVFLTFCCACHAMAADVFLVTGQSNAKIELARGIEDTLRASGRFPDLKVLWINHSGRSLATWYDNGPKANYAADFFSTDGSGSGLLESAMSGDGGPHTFRALFWFQGEADMQPDGLQKYHQRFTGMLDRLSQDLGKGPEFAKSGLRYHLALVDRQDADPEAIRTVQRKMVADHSAHAGLIDTRDYVRWDGLHIVRELLYDLGRRMANQYLAESGYRPVVFEYHWAATENRRWGHPANWQAKEAPAAGSFKPYAIFGEQASPPDGEVIVESPSSINGLFFSGNSGINRWRLSGTSPLAIHGDIDVRGTAVELDLTLTGSAGITGRDAVVAIRGRLQGGDFYLGSHGLPANVYQINGIDCFTGITGMLQMGGARTGAAHGTKILVNADQTASCTTRIQRGYTIGNDEAVVTVRNGATWTQSGGKPLQLGMSTSIGAAQSNGALLLGESDSQSGGLRVMSGSACEVGVNAGIGRIEVDHGWCLFEGAGQKVVLGGATYRSDLKQGAGGKGHLRIRPGGTVETARGFVSKRIQPAAGAAIEGSGTLYLAGGNLRLIEGASYSGLALDLCGSEGPTTRPVRMVLEDGTKSTVDTNGFDAVCNTPLEGNGTWVKTGAGTLRFSVANDSFPSTHVEQGELRFDHPLRIPEGSVIVLSGGRLAAPSIQNNGTLILRSRAVIEVDAEFINRGTIDTREWNGALPTGFANSGNWLQRDAPRVENTRVSNGRFIIEMRASGGLSHRLEEWNPESGTWFTKGADVSFDGTSIRFSIPIDKNTGIFRIAVNAVEP
jgi:hypothetical protein